MCPEGPQCSPLSPPRPSSLIILEFPKSSDPARRLRNNHNTPLYRLCSSLEVIVSSDQQVFDEDIKTVQQTGLAVWEWAGSLWHWYVGQHDSPICEKAAGFKYRKDIRG